MNNHLKLCNKNVLKKPMHLLRKLLINNKIIVIFYNVTCHLCNLKIIVTICLKKTRLLRRDFYIPSIIWQLKRYLNKKYKTFYKIIYLYAETMNWVGSCRTTLKINIKYFITRELFIKNLFIIL